MTYYDYIAEGYDELHREEQLNKLRIIRENLDIRSNDKILDVGCGTGLSAEILPGIITGVDPSEKLLKKCKFHAVKGVAEELPFPDNTFDIVISVTAIHNFEFIRKGLEEMRRVGNGRFAFSVLKKADRFAEIGGHIRELFDVIKIIEEDKDAIYFCTKTY